MPARRTIQTALMTLVVAWTLAVVAQTALTTGRWLSTLGQALVLFIITGALAWAGATTDNLIDDLLGRGGGGGGRGRRDEDQPGGPRAWRVHVPAQEGSRPRPGGRRR